MRELQNVLYVQTQGAVLHAEHDTVRAEAEGQTLLRAPLLRLSGIVVFGRVTVTPFLIHRCAEDGHFIAWLDRAGRFKARIEGPTRGNVLLRRAQHLALSDPLRTLDIARQIVAAKIQNARQVVLRSARETDDRGASVSLARTAERLAATLARLRESADLNQARGCEGESARAYFETLPWMIRTDDPAFSFDGRTRRPPRDRVNAVLSFLYAMLRTECASALEAAGLDPQIGYLHGLRPGRPGLALDLMEELRSPIAERLALTLLNRGQLRRNHFEAMPGGAFGMTDEGRRVVISAYQKRKEAAMRHRVLRQPIQVGLIPHVQARLLARHLRGELRHYPPFLYR